MNITIGHLGDAYGIKGWLHLVSYANPPDNIFKYQNWFIKKDFLLQIESFKKHGNHFVVKLKNCEDRDQALQFKHQDIFIDRVELPPLSNNEYYWSDLVGLAVHNARGECLGVIDHLFETGSNDVIVVNHHKIKQARLIKQYFIPYLKSVVKEIDLTKKTMIVDWEE